MNLTVANATAADGTRTWVPLSNDRGTLDIVISCAITTFLCIWTCVCVNVPAPGKASWDNFVDRWHMFCLGMLGPEFVLLLAMGQYYSAESSRVMFKRSHPDQDWTLRHSYFADMGAIHIKFPNWKSFPVNGKQLHLLIAQHHIDFPSWITLDVIKDKNKRDGLSRSVLPKAIKSIH